MGNDERELDDRQLDEAIEESFPASDPPANTVETGIHLDIDSAAAAVIDNRAANRFELTAGDDTAVLIYQRTPTSLVLVHTEVPPAMRGKHIADALAKSAIERAHAEHLQVVVVCPFVKAYLQRHPQ